MADEPRYTLTPEGHRKTVANGKVHVNVNAGIMMKTTPSGLKVCMYLAKPGEYWTIKGEPVPEAVAAKAGFPVEQLRRECDFLRDQNKARAALLSVGKGGSLVKELERGPYALYSVGSGLAVIYKDGERLDDNPGPYAVVKELFDDFTAGLPEEGEPIAFTRAKETGDAVREGVQG